MFSNISSGKITYPQIESLQTICSKMNHLGGKHCYPLANRSVARMSWSSIPGSE